MKQASDSARLGIVLYDGVEPIDLGGTAGVVSMASRLLPNLSCVLIAEKAGPVRLTGGVTVMAEADFATAPPCDVYVVCGGPGWRVEAANPAMLAFLRGKRREELASVCTGALILAAAGTLDGLRATTRRAAAGAETIAPLVEMTRLAAGVRPEPALVVEDEGVVTSGGVSLAIDGTLYLIGRIYGEEARDAVAQLIEYDRAFAANAAALGIA
jgi:transcriptional regulator GlxA family with amidase domain